MPNTLMNIHMTSVKWNSFTFLIDYKTKADNNNKLSKTIVIIVISDEIRQKAQQ